MPGSLRDLRTSKTERRTDPLAKKGTSSQHETRSAPLTRGKKQGLPQKLSVPCLVKKSEFAVIQALFNQADSDRDGVITQAEFEVMRSRARQRSVGFWR